MIASELLRLRYALAGRVLLAVLVAEAVIVGLLLAFLPTVIDALITLNEVIPNATSADQFTDEELTALTLASAQLQVLIADVLGSAGLGASLPVIAAALLGALTITGEFRRGSITNSVLAQPTRWRLIVAKMIALTGVVTAAALLLAVIRAGLVGVGLAALALLFFGGPNPTLHLPFGLVCDIARNSPLTILGADAPLAARLPAPVAIITLLIWAGALLAFATIRFSREDIPAPS